MKLIIVGGNSQLISNFLKLDLEIFYKEVFIISHRKLRSKSHHNIIENLNPNKILQTIIRICSDNLFSYDIIFSNTPPLDSDFNNEKTREWSMTILKMINTISFNKNINKAIYVGSCLPLLPLYHDSIYKRIKDLEMRCYFDLNYQDFSKNSYFILPPLKSQNKVITNLISENYQKWSLEIYKELKLKNSIVFPSGLIGLITKILFIIRFKKL